MLVPRTADNPLHPHKECPMPLRWILSLIFLGQMYLMMAVVAVVFAIPALIIKCI